MRMPRPFFNRGHHVIVWWMLGVETWESYQVIKPQQLCCVHSLDPKHQITISNLNVAFGAALTQLRSSKSWQFGRRTMCLN